MNKALMLSTSIVAAATLFGTAAAQDDEIIVTATKREQTLQEVPVAVTVVDNEVIERAAVQDILDLQSVVPTLRVSQLERTGNTTLIVRGFGNGGNNIGVEPSVALYVDGVFRSRAPATLGDLPALERVEVLRGPQNTLFGKGASAGVVSIVTQAPQFDWQGNVEVTGGNYELMQGKFYVTGPLSDTTAISLAGNIQQRDGYVDNTLLDSTINDRDRWSWRAQLLSEVSDNVSLRYIGDFESIDENCCYAPFLNDDSIFTGGSGTTELLQGLGADTTVDPFSYEVALNRDPENEIENWGISQELNVSYGFADFVSITSYRESFNFSNGDVDFGSAPLIAGNRNEVNIDTFTQEFRLTSNGGGRLDWLVGGFFMNETILSRSDIIYDTGFAAYASGLAGGQTDALCGLLQIECFAPNTGSFERFEQDNENWSLFAQGDFAITDRLTGTLGVGYVNDHKEVLATAENTDAFAQLDLSLFGAQALGALQFLPPFVPLDEDNPVENQDSDDEEVTYTARLAFDATSNVNVYGSYSTGFKPTSWNLTRDSSPTAEDAAILNQAAADNPGEFGEYALGNRLPGTRFAGPEEVEVFELGAKFQFDRGYLNVAVFDQTIEGFQSTIFSGTGFVLDNAGEQNAQGFEWDGAYEPVEGLTLGFAGLLIDPVFEEFTGAAVVTGSDVDLEDGVADGIGDLSGEEVAGVHTVSLSFSAQYEAELSNGTFGFIRGDYQYEDEVAAVQNIDPEVASREVNILNASAGLIFENGIEATVWGRNITNDEFVTSAFPTTAQSTISGYPNAPATYGVTVRKRF